VLPRPGPVPTSAGPSHIPVPTGSQSAAFDRAAHDRFGIAGEVLMENAGRAAALVLQHTYPAGSVVVVAGAGNNGGDGVVLARTLAAAGWPVELLVCGDRPDPDPLLHGWAIPTRRASTVDALPAESFARASIIVDALLGTGLRGAPRPFETAVIRAMNEAEADLVALDLPSGVDADTGATPGESVRAGLTVAFGAPKLGTLLHPGRACTGGLIAIDIGFPPWEEGDASALLLTGGWAARHRPRRPPTAHKNSAGRLLVLAGSPGMAGAAVLATRAALRSGAGFVRVAVPGPLRDLLQSLAPEAVCIDAADPAALADAVRASDAVAAGPGLGTGEAALAALRIVLGEARERALVLDADALNLLATGRLELPAGADPERMLLTPHPGEAARLLGPGSSPALGGDPVAAVRRLADRFGATVLLKGATSLVGAPGKGPLLVAARGSSDQARAGMGDVLTGTAGAFAARGCAASVAGGLALHFTGIAADRAAKGEALLPTDVIEELPGALVSGGPNPDADPAPTGIPFVILDLPPAR
jgi:ADP-dependent NAD(P)H-hydrate dehydratase / NAD(P)H-hydrate epimerase